MRVYYAGDIHGSEMLFRKFLGAAKFYDVDALVLGGDITGKVMVPLIERKPGRWEGRLLGRTRKAKNEQQLEALEKDVRFNGFYPYRCSPEEYDRLAEDEAYRDQTFGRLMRDEVARWIRLAEDRLGDSGVGCFIMPGNDDDWETDEALESSYVVNPDGRVVDVGQYQMLSCAWTNPTPWDSPRELPDDEFWEKLARIAADLDPERPAIFNLHCPPYDTPLDRAPALTDDLQVITEGGEPKLVPVGSRSIRRLIEERQPLVSLHGHVHESRGVCRLGRTVCVNPGSVYSEGVIDGVVVELDGGDVRSSQLVSG